jgi:uncharacterized protein
MVIFYSLFGAAVFLLAVLFSLYAFRFETTNFVVSVRKIYLREKDTKKGQRQELVLRILHLSDFHLRKDRKGRHLYAFVESLQSIEADLILITGDMVEKDTLFDHLISMLSGFRARYGIYAVFGAHDYYNKRPTEFVRNMFAKKESYARKNDTGLLTKKLEKIGVTTLLNDSRTIQDGQDFAAIEIIGIDDPIIGKTDIGRAFAKVEKGSVSAPPAGAVSGKRCAREKKEAFAPNKEKVHVLHQKGRLRIALVHTPDADVLTDLHRNDVDIVFAGHTHGGQIRLPLAGAIISGCNLKVKFAAGLFYFKNSVLHVSRGLGEGRYSPFRFFCSPEAIILEVYKV